MGKGKHHNFLIVWYVPVLYCIYMYITINFDIYFIRSLNLEASKQADSAEDNESESSKPSFLLFQNFSAGETLRNACNIHLIYSVELCGCFW